MSAPGADTSRAGRPANSAGSARRRALIAATSELQAPGEVEVYHPKRRVMPAERDRAASFGGIVRLLAGRKGQGEHGSDCGDTLGVFVEPTGPKIPPAGRRGRGVETARREAGERYGMAAVRDRNEICPWMADARSRDQPRPSFRRNLVRGPAAEAGNLGGRPGREHRLGVFGQQVEDDAQPLGRRAGYDRREIFRRHDVRPGIEDDGIKAQLGGARDLRSTRPG